MDWWQQSAITACKDDQVSGIWSMTVIFLYMVNFLLPFLISYCWQGICDYDVISSNRLYGCFFTFYSYLFLFRQNGVKVKYVNSEKRLKKTANLQNSILKAYIHLTCTTADYKSYYRYLKHGSRDFIGRVLSQFEPY